jgi:hypothetical protein
MHPALSGTGRDHQFLRLNHHTVRAALSTGDLVDEVARLTLSPDPVTVLW